MARRFLLLVALLVCITLRGRTQNDQTDPLGSAFRVSVQEAIRSKLTPQSCAVIFSGGLHSYDSQGLFPNLFDCDPDFYYLSGFQIPDAVMVLFKEPQSLVEGKVSTLLFLPDQNDQGLASFGLTYNGKFGLQENGIAYRTSTQWSKFCKEILASEDIQRIYSKPFPISSYQKPGEPDNQVLGREFYALLAPGFAFETKAQRFYKEIQAADSTTLAALKGRINAAQRYTPNAYHDPILDRLMAVTRSQDLLKLQKEIAAIKIDLQQFSNWMDRLIAHKSTKEIGLIKSIAKNLNQAFKESISRMQANVYEAEIEGIASYLLRKNQCSMPMPLRVASGKRSAAPNYIENNARMVAGDLCVLDLAAAQNGYALRATRTLAVGGTFAADDAAVYASLLSIHKANLLGCKVGASPIALNEAANATFEKLHDKQIFSTNGLGRKLVLQIANIRLVGIGLEGQNFPGKLEAGMMLEVETALYLPELRGVTEKWQGKGFVLRDYVLLSDTGNEVITREIPSEIVELEALVHTANKTPIH